MYRITLIEGDGIGPEVISSAKRVLETLKLDIEWEVMPAGLSAQEKYSSLLPKETLDSIKKNKIALKGPITTPVGSGYRSVNVALRQELDLYACVRPSWYIEDISPINKNFDIVVIRENTEDLYAGIEFKKDNPNTLDLIKHINSISEKKLREDSAISIKTISYFGSKRIVEFAFNFALQEKRKKVTCVHKANIMKFTDGLFLETFREIASKYPQIESNDIIVDNLAMQLVKRPDEFDVLVLPNLYGDIISDLCAGLMGGLGLAPGANVGDTIAVFEPVHGSAPKYAFLNKVNPMATIFSCYLLLKYLKEDLKAKILKDAVLEVIKEKKYLTYDLKPNRDDSTSVGTSEVTSAIISKIKDNL